MGISKCKRNSSKGEEIKRLKDKLEKQEEKIRQYKKEIATNSVIERWKIGEYLHDNLAQQLTSAKIHLTLLKEELTAKNHIEACNKILDIISESADEVRDLSHDVIPMDVEKEGVGQAFKHLKNQMERQHGVDCKLETTEILEKINRRKVATNLYNIAQEAIKNAVVHGEASNIKIAIIEHDQKLYLHIKDDGTGFDSVDKKKGSGMGITIMRHRAEELGGNLRIRKAKERNEFTTCVTCTLPLNALTPRQSS